MKICLGEENELPTLNRLLWIQENFDRQYYTIISTGFLINEWFVEFTDEKYATLYYLRYPEC